jgi:hypothetical protein
MRSGEALRLALRDLYGNSWRLVPLNALLGAVLVAAGIVALAVHAAFIAFVLAGPVAAALVHASVTVVRTGNLALADGLVGLRAHWRRGLVLGTGATAFALVAAVALHVYARASVLTLPLAFLTLYLVFLLGVYQVVLWTVAIAEPERSLRAAARGAADVVLHRPGATAALGLALLVVNLAGLAAAVMPFLTVTLAFSFVAVAHFALPRPAAEEPA